MKAHDSETFNVYYREFYPKIYRYTFGLIGNHQEAEQLAQEAFASLYSYVSSGLRIQNVKALIYRIAHNKIVNYVKRREKLDRILRQHFDPTKSSSLGDEEEILIKKQRAVLIRRALFRLPPIGQKCVLLYQEGFSYSEIAESSGIKKTSVGKILARSIKRLAQEINYGVKS
jgi:RNA polymerase sigma-70 factor (ECF subfamily)